MPPRKQQQKQQAKQEEEEEESQPSGGSQSESESEQSGSQQSGSESGSESGSGDDSDEFPDVSDDEGEGSSEVEELQVEFEFFPPEEKDFHGLKCLLVPYLDGQEFHSSGLIDAIIAEGDNQGAVVKTDSDDDPIALMSVLNTQKYKDEQFMQQTKQFLLDKCPKQANGKQLAELCRKAFDSPGTGLLLNERFINAPPKLSPPLVMFLMDSLKEHAESGQPDSHHSKYERFLLATRVYMDKSAATRSGAVNSSSGAASSSSTGAGSSERPSKKQKQEDAGTSSSLPPANEIIFSRPEDQYFHQHCSWYYTFPVESRPVGKDGLQQCRLVMQVDADKVPAAQKLLDEEVGNMAKDFGNGAEQDAAKVAGEAKEASTSKAGGKKKKATAGAAKAVQLS